MKTDIEIAQEAAMLPIKMCIRDRCNGTRSNGFCLWCRYPFISPIQSQFSISCSQYHQGRRQYGFWKLQDSEYQQDVYKRQALPSMADKNISLKGRYDDGFCLMESDLVKSLIINLIDNAKKAIDDSGNIQMCIRDRRPFSKGIKLLTVYVFLLSRPALKSTNRL